jgi:hypothetical protein
MAGSFTWLHERTGWVTESCRLGWGVGEEFHLWGTLSESCQSWRDGQGPFRCPKRALPKDQTWRLGWLSAHTCPLGVDLTHERPRLAEGRGKQLVGLGPQ